MSDNLDVNESFDETPVTDDHAPLAIAAGLVVALIGGGLWALLVRFTGYEIGYVAWGIGLMVGIAMTRVTSARTQQLAYTAAGLALLGLLAGKVFIFLGSAGPMAKELAGNDEMLKAGVAWQLYEERKLDAATLEELDRTQAAGDTLSDAVWASMLAQAGTRLDAMTPEARQAAATSLARGWVQQTGVVDGIKGQLTLFDLLWVFLAVGTAYRMLAPTGPVRESQPA